MSDQQHARTFTADAASRRAGSRPWTAAILALALLSASVYFLGLTVFAIVAVLTIVIAVPLVLRHARAQDKGEVDLTAGSVISRRGTDVLATVDRHSPSYDVAVFSDAYGRTTQVLITDGSQHIRLVSGSWPVSTLRSLAAAASPHVDRPRTATWQELKAAHPEALAFWERHTGLVIAGVLVGIPALVIIGGVLAILLFDVG